MMDKETLDEILARHRKEAKELQGKITGLKKAVGSDKKKKKELPDQIAALEAELKQRQDAEVQAAKARVEEQGQDDPDVESISEGLTSTSIDNSNEQQHQTATKKPNRQQQRKARKAANFEEERKKAEEEAANTVNMREVEDEAIRNIVVPWKLRVKQIIADGHCLYNAVSDQVALQSNSDPLGYQYFRKTAASFMRSHPDEFLPYLVNDDGDMLNDDEYAKYCDDVEASATWGGQLEIKAMSSALKREIHIVQMGSPVVKIGDEFKSNTAKPLMLSYHRHHYGLGEHYNSLVPLSQQ
ncbi:hypothetical protein BDR26DRAFT_921741 [Obelidium mucronatum]|nr:hypothetical protein BDR26DRAFT_921741 [Obelidium mucronatum]